MRERIKPRILLTPDTRGWAFDFHCEYQADALRKRGWQVDAVYLLDNTPPPAPPAAYDLVFDPVYTPQKMDRLFHGKLIRGIYGHKWEWGQNPRRQLDRALDGAVAVIVPNKKLQAMIRWYFPRTYAVAEGTDPALFQFHGHRADRRLIVGWTGNPAQKWKRLDDILRPACAQAGVELRVATDLPRAELCRFYNEVDLVCVAAIEEGSPNAVFEAGACGRAVLATPVGIIPEAICDGKNGLIAEGSVEAFADRLRWCQDHIDEVRVMGLAHRDVVLARYTVQREAEEIAELMETILLTMRERRTPYAGWRRAAGQLWRKAASARRQFLERIP